MTNESAPPTVTTYADYFVASAATAVYPKQAAYPFLGLVGECGELALAVTLRSDQVAKEAGDVAWYVSAICRDVGLNFADIMTTSDQEHRFYDGDEIMMACGRVCEIAKKCLRDASGDWSDGSRKADLFESLQAIAIWWNAMLVDFMLRPMDVLQTNITKLHGRAARGTLAGSGDSR